MKSFLFNLQFQRIFLLLLGVVLYFSMLNNWFSGFAGDDDWMVYENLHVFNLSPENVTSYFSSFYRGQYSPVNTLAYGLIYLLFGIDPLFFHGFSLILHLCNTLLVFELIRRLLHLKRGSIAEIQIQNNSYQSIAFVTALLFLVHPLQVESVVWISASKVLLYSCFFLSGLILYLRYLITSKKVFYCLTFLIFVLAFGAKEQTVVFPLVLVLLDWYLNRDLKSKRVIIEKIPFFLFSLGFSIITILAQQTGFSNKLQNEYYPLMDRLFLASYAFVEYLIKLFIPFKLSAWYKFPMGPGEALPSIYYFYPIIVLFMGYYLWKFWSEKKYLIVFGFVFFTVNIMLTLHILPMARGVLMADRYVYLGSIGIFFITSSYLVNSIQKNHTSARSKLIMSCFIVYMIVLSSYTYWYIDQWNIV